MRRTEAEQLATGGTYECNKVELQIKIGFFFSDEVYSDRPEIVNLGRVKARRIDDRKLIRFGLIRINLAWPSVVDSTELSR